MKICRAAMAHNIPRLGRLAVPLALSAMPMHLAQARCEEKDGMVHCCALDRRPFYCCDAPTR